VGDADDREDVATNAVRVAHVDALQAEIDALLGDRKAEDVLAELVAAGVPAGRIRTMPEVYGWEQVRHLGLVHHLAHATLGDIAVPGGALRYDGTTAASTTPPPLLGEHEDLSWEAPWLDQQEVAS
jgi:formyl-CoA transferase